MNIKDFTFLKKCNCGKKHFPLETEIIFEKNAVLKIPGAVKRLGGSKAFIVSDMNTYKEAGDLVTSVLKAENIPYSEYIFPNSKLEPDEKALGATVVNYDDDCDIVLAIGSGVINDISKILSKITKNPYIIFATAPSMDGYASATSSMSVNGLKASISSKCPDIIIGDIDIIKNVPEKMLKAGLGDIIAKYVSICEWRISHEINGEYYCESIAELIRNALKNCANNAQGLLKRDEMAVKAVFEGLILSGAAMAFAGVSRPASGVEHYISHIWDMRGLEFNTPVELHGLQCAIGTLIAARVYEQVKKVTPDRKKALEYAESFDIKKHNSELREFLGKSAEAMILLEEKEQKYNLEKHKKRLEIIIEKWDKILKIIDEELPSAKCIEGLLDVIKAPKLPEEIGLDNNIIFKTFKYAADIRDKYVLPRLCWDLGIIDEIKI